MNDSEGTGLGDNTLAQKSRAKNELLANNNHITKAITDVSSAGTSVLFVKLIHRTRKYLANLK